jgi:3',5'-cyclic AMP phosphodiesterase CpdA
MIPGNHDQPLLPPIERLFTPYARYNKYICGETDTTLVAGSLFVAGLNDNRPILPGGFWSARQRAWLTDQCARAPHDAIKVVATHHQVNWDGKMRPAGFWFPTRALRWLARRGVELVLNGHTHVPRAVQSPEGIVVARSGTATSSRTRHGHGNAYNLITLDEKQISVFVRQYDAHSDAFMAVQAITFPRRPRPL